MRGMCPLDHLELFPKHTALRRHCVMGSWTASRTPPELRSGCGAPSFVQPELSNSLGNSYENSRNGGPKGANMDQNGVVRNNFNRLECFVVLINFATTL